MGLFDRFRRNKQDKFQNEVRSIVTNMYGGNFNYFVWNYANQIYNIPEVRTAIEKIADIFSSIDKYNIRVNSETDDIKYLSDTTYRVLNYQPNPLQNATQFYKNVVTELLLENNAFVLPIFDNKSGNLRHLYPLLVDNINFTLDSNNVAHVEFYNKNTSKMEKHNMQDLIYFSRFCTLSGGKSSSLGLYETVLKSLGEQIVNTASPNKPRAILQSNQVGQGQLKDKDKKGVTEEVKARFADNVQGVAYLDKMWTITPINWNENDVNQKLMQMVINIVYNYFSINENIINNKASEIEMTMFINTTIKPLARQFAQEFTNKLFTENEFYFGRRIIFDYQSLSVSTLQSRTNFYQTGLRNGFLNIDEVRELEGYGSLPNGKGKVYRTSADLVNVEIVDDYELGKVNKTLSEVSTTENVSHETLEVDDINQKKEDANG